MRIRVIQHVDFEGTAGIARWAKARGAELLVSRPDKGEPLPRGERRDLLVVLGGPMSVGDTAEYPWLVGEKQFLRAALERGEMILGICLGAQLLAELLGGTVTQNVAGPEIGWFPVALDPAARDLRWFSRFPDSVMAFHWHGDTFSLPPNAVPIGNSAACANQGFAWGGHVLGLQFHLEATREWILGLMERAGKLPRGEFVQDPRRIAGSPDDLDALERRLDELLDSLVR